jgi:hypothetical protein
VTIITDERIVVAFHRVYGTPELLCHTPVVNATQRVATISGGLEVNEEVLDAGNFT